MALLLGHILVSTVDANTATAIVLGVAPATVEIRCARMAVAASSGQFGGAVMLEVDMLASLVTAARWYLA